MILKVAATIFPVSETFSHSAQTLVEPITVEQSKVSPISNRRGEESPKEPANAKELPKKTSADAKISPYFVPNLQPLEHKPAHNKSNKRILKSRNTAGNKKFQGRLIMTLAQAQLSKHDPLILTKRRSHEKSDNPMSPMIEKKCAKPKLLEHDSIVLTKKRTPNCIHKRDGSLALMEDSSPEPIPPPPPTRKQSLNSLFKAVSLKHGIPEAELDTRVLTQPDSVLLKKRKSLGGVRAENDGDSECSKPRLLQQDSIALAKKRTPSCIHSK